MTKPPPPDFTELLETARKRWREGEQADHDNRQRAIGDAEFASGDQWEAAAEAERRAAGRPTLTINRVNQFVRQVTGEIRMARPSIRVRPVEANDDATAEVYEGLVRHIEQRSKASRIYAAAADQSTIGGMAAWRVAMEYASDDGFDAELRIVAIKDPLSVVWDPAAQEYDRRDAGWCFVVEDMPTERFKAHYPDARPGGWDRDYSDFSGWSTSDTVRVAEYWCVKHEPAQIVQLADGSIRDLTADLEAASSKGAVQIVRQREVQRAVVEMYLMTASEVLSGPHRWPGKRIPIVPVWGEETMIGAKVMRTGMVHHLRDSQRLFNFARSADLEAYALQPKAPWLVTSEQIEGLEDEWSKSNRGTPAVLRYRGDTGHGAPQRINPPAFQGAVMQLAGTAADDMKAVTGIYDAALGARSNETSGVAIQAREQAADVGTFVYIDNLYASIQATGEIIVEVIPSVYDTQRQVRILGREDEVKVIEVNGPNGPDLSRGSYDVQVQTGPGFSTRREKAAAQLTQFVQAVPASAPLLGDILAKMQDWPQADEVAERLSSMLPPELRKGQDGQPVPPPAPPPGMMEQQQAAVMRAQGEAREAVAKAQLAELQVMQARAQMGIMPPPGAPQPPPFAPGGLAAPGIAPPLPEGAGPMPGPMQ